MGYKHMTDLNHQVSNGTSGNSVFTYHINNLASSSSTPSGMREDILLASWLIVLLRTREGERVSFDWSYHSNGSEESPRHLSMEDVLGGLEDSIENVIGAISSQISRVGSKQNHADAVSLLLSTSDLSQTFENLTVRSSSTVQYSI
jgi:hypothetical protein